MQNRNAPRKLRIAIVEDEGLFRDLLRVSLGQSGVFDVVGAFADGKSALDELPALRPDVAILDIRLAAGMNGVELGLRLRRAQPELGIVLLSNYREPAFLHGVPQGEAAGWSYLLKSSITDLAALVRAVEGAALGLMVLDPRLVQAARAQPGGALTRLTPRQREILELMAQGLSNEGIASHLNLSLKTVANQINGLYQELGIGRTDTSLQPRVQAVLTYLREVHLPG